MDAPEPTAEPTVLQTGPETFEVWVEGHRASARLSHRTRRGLGLSGVPPVEVASELVRFLCERHAWPWSGSRESVDVGADLRREVDLGPAAGRFPEFTEELRARLG